MPEAESIAQLVGVTKRYGDVTVVDELTVSIGRGEFFSLLGPSGCGKTTSLRMLAGFIIPDTGRVLLEGRDVTAVPPYRRDVNTVFQSYALFPHLSVADNVAFGLKRRRVGKQEIRRRVGEMLELVGLLDRADAMPSELSGGQRQRVALARSLVNMPKVLLLDEPLGALDLKLRRQMQLELKRIQREVGITFVYVTHDQEEALTMSDRIAVMNSGRIEQIDRPDAIYDRPATAFVAGFIGSSNLLSGRLVPGGVRLDTGVEVPAVGLPPSAPAQRVVISVRPEKLVLDASLPAPAAVLDGEVVDVVYLGVTTHYTVDCSGGLRLTVAEPSIAGEVREPKRPGDRVRVGWRAADAVVLADQHPVPRVAAQRVPVSK